MSYIQIVLDIDQQLSSRDVKITVKGCGDKSRHNGLEGISCHGSFIFARLELFIARAQHRYL
jgi:hypothetical protein